MDSGNHMEAATHQRIAVVSPAAGRTPEHGRGDVRRPSAQRPGVGRCTEGGEARSSTVRRNPFARDRALTRSSASCLHPGMFPLEPLTRRRAVDLVRVAAALCRHAR